MKPFFFFARHPLSTCSSLSFSCPSLVPFFWLLIPAQYFLTFLFLLPPAEGLTVPPPVWSLTFLFITQEVIVFFAAAFRLEGILILGGGPV